MPECGDSLKNILVYVDDEGAFKTCNGKEWVVTQIANKGDKGDGGDRGPSGVVNADITAQLQAIWKNNIESNVYIEVKYEKTGCGPGDTSCCTQYEGGSGFVVGQDLVATAGHVVAPTVAATCGTLPMVNARIWFPTGPEGDTKHNTLGASASATKVDRSIAATDDTALVQIATGAHKALKISALDEAADHISGTGVKLGDDVLLMGFSGATTFAHFTPGKINAIQKTGSSFLNSLVQQGVISAGKLVYEYDLVSGGGASGAAVFGLNGEVIGINFAGNTADADTDFGFAVQIKPLRDLLAAPRNWTNL